MGSRTVCFVCGNLGADSGRVLHTKPRLDKGPYFPFLEDHEPPKGARLAGQDGAVDCCRVCHAFLTQQWDTHERNKTPSVKRLYWLKRSDNGQFTGAEMRLQGEYIAQVMGLQYNPGSAEPAYNQSASPTVTKSRMMSMVEPSGYPQQAAPEVALDLTVHKNNGHTSSGRDYRMNNGEQQHPPPLPPQQQQSSGHRDSNMLPADNRRSSAPPTSAPSSSCSSKYVCFTCGTVQQSITRRFIYACRQPSGEAEPFFPFLTRLTTKPGASPLSEKGIAVVCNLCRRSLYQQWKEHEIANNPLENRNYSISKVDKAPSDSKETISINNNTNNNSRSSERSLQSVTPNKEICYLCGQYMSSSRLLHTLPSKDSRSISAMHFPFIRDLPRPEGAHPLNPDGTVLSCRICFDHLAAQWHMFESQNVKLSQRHFTLAMSLNRGTYTYQSSEPSNFSSTPDGDVSQPLNIQITSGSPVPVVPTGSQGLLAIATPISSSSNSNHNSNNGEVAAIRSSSSSYSNQFPSSHDTRSRASSIDLKPNLATLNNSLNSSNNTIVNSVTSVASVPHPLQRVSNLPKKVCFLCGESCLVSNMHVLCSYPARHDAKVPNGQTSPFFPFLANRDPSQGADTMSDEGTVMSCQYCYHMLLIQWKDYENSKTPGTSNRWLRKYIMKNFICYVCSRSAERTKVCTLQFVKFPFLKDHKVPPGGLVMDNGENVVVCKGCSRSLLRQYAEFERIGLRIELRKYNWIQRPGDEYLDDADSQADEINASVNLDEADGNSTVHHTADLSITATSHWSSSAHQEDGPNVKAVPPSTTSVSPRASTPKRGPPPLVYSSQSSSSSYLTSPPVVTIAPTQAHPTHLHSEAHSQNLERTHSVQSSSSSLYDPLSIKQERDHRPLSSQSRDGDNSKECIIQPSHRTASSALSSSSTHGRDDLPPRGFQPYRPEEDIRPMLPSPFGLDAAAYPYHPALFPQHYPHPAFSRIDDPLVMERCRLMHPPFMPFSHPGIIPPPGVHPFLASSRYPTDVLHQQYPYLPNSSRLAGYRSPGPNDRPRQEDEKLKRLDNDREIEREKEREQREKEREIERQKEIEQREQQQQEKERLRELDRQQLERQHEAERRKVEVNYLREDERRHSLHQQSDSSYSGSITQGTPRDVLYGDRLAPPSSNSSSNGVPDLSHHPHRGSRTSYDHGDHGERDRVHNLSSSSSRHEMKQEQEAHQPSNNRHSSSPAVHIDVDRRKHHSSYLPKNDFTITRIAKEQHNNSDRSSSNDRITNHNSIDRSISHLNNQPRSVDSKGGGGHDQRDDHRSSRPPPLIPPNRSSHNDLDRTEKTAAESGLFRPYDVLLYNRYSNHQYPEQATKTEGGLRVVNSYDPATSRSSNRASEHPSALKPDIANDSSSRHRSSHDEPQFDVNSSICSQVVGKNQPQQQHEASSNHYSQYFRSGHYDHSLSGHINSVVDASFHVYTDEDVVSKLDVEESKMRDSRLNGTYCSDSEEDEEIVAAMEMERKQQLTIIITGPPIPLDTSRNKMRYLKTMGLTTHSRRRDLDLERHRKRRLLLREGSLSPLPTEPDKEEPPPSGGLPVPPPYLSEQLCMQPDYRNKCRFLHSLSLSALTAEKKRELQAIQQACEEERARRLGLVLDKDNNNTSGQQQQQHTEGDRHLQEAQKRSKPVLLDSLPQRTKRKHSEIEGTSQVPNKHDQQTQPTRPKITLSQLQERHLAAAAALSAASSTSSSSSQQHYHKASISTPPPPATATGGQPGVNPSSSSRPPNQQESSRTLIFPESRGDSRDHRRLSEKFAQEFHESVLASTFSKSANGRTGMKILEVGGSSSSLKPVQPPATDLSVSSAPPSLHTTQKTSSSLSLLSHDHASLSSRSDDGRMEFTESTRGSPVSFKWPGVETILEAYQRHLDEQKLERLILHERCQKLKTDNFDLKKTAEKLSRRVSTLLDSKTHDDEEYRRCRSSVDTLKHYYLQLPR